MKITVGNRKVSLSDVANIALFGADHEVELDQTLLDRLSATLPKAKMALKSAAFRTPPALPSSQSENEQAANAVPAPFLRACMFSRLVSIMQQRLFIRKEVAAALAAVLNANITPFVPINDAPYHQNGYDIVALVVLQALRGEGHCLVEGRIQGMSEALSAAGISPVSEELTPLEVQTFCQGSPFAVAVASLVIHGAQGLVTLSEVAAAMSCEVSRQLSTKPFDSENFELPHPHRGILASAANVRLLLDNSKMMLSSGAKAPEPPSCLRYIPQYLGPVRESIDQARRSMTLEINSSEAGPFDASAVSPGPMHGQAVATVLSAVGNAVSVLLSTSQDRLAVVAARAGRSVEDELKGMSVQDSSNELRDVTCSTTASVSRDGVLDGAVVVQIFDLVKQAEGALRSEISACLTAYDEEENNAREAAKKKQEAAAKHAAASAVAEANANANAAGDASLEGKSDKEKKKIEEKRAKKLAEKMAKKAAKSKKEDFKIGNGTAEIRSFFQKKLAAGTVDTDAVDAFDVRADATIEFVRELESNLSSGGARRKPKIAKGAQDFKPAQMHLREKIFNKIRTVFKNHGGQEIDTPVFELKETLTGKYGEDSKLIYDLADQGGELLALRYDLTVPFARFMALHAPGNIKRFHIARVYRRDNPQMARGRFREFYQCDFDIAGTYDSMLPDAEILCIGVEVYRSFPELGPFTIKLNHRRLLDAIFAICGVPEEKFRTTCSAIDKLDKEPWENVYREMVEEKGILPEVASRIETFVMNKGQPKELHKQLMDSNLFGSNSDANEAMNELGTLFSYLEAMGILDYVSFDLSLARGLDYYTGLIYEVVLTGGGSNVGSIGAGGRYDNLVGMFSVSGHKIPCIGISVGIERIFGILQAHAEKEKELKEAHCEVLVASATNHMVLERLSLCKALWDANISAQTVQQENPKFTKQLRSALEAGMPFMIVVGEDELARGEVTIKKMSTKEELCVKREDMVEELVRLGCRKSDMLNV